MFSICAEAEHVVVQSDKKLFSVAHTRSFGETSRTVREQQACKMSKLADRVLLLQQLNGATGTCGIYKKHTSRLSGFLSVSVHISCRDCWTDSDNSWTDLCYKVLLALQYSAQ